MLFSSSITKETEIIFKSFDGLNDAKQSLINSRLYKSLGVIYLNEIKNWDIKKGNDSEHQSMVSKHFLLVLWQKIF